MLFVLLSMSVAFAKTPAPTYASASFGVPDEMQNELEILTPVEDETQQEQFTLQATDVTSTSATLRWSSEQIVLGYSICRFNVIKNEWEPFIDTPETQYKFVNLKPQTTYKYCLINSATGDLLGVEEFTTGMRVPSLKVTQTHSDSVKLRIKNVEKNTKVNIYKKAEGEKFEKIATVSANKKSYLDKDVDEATTYYYKAKAVVTRRKNGKKKNKMSAASKTVNTTTLKELGLPKVSGRLKSFAYYTAVTVKSSPQYKLLNSKECYTDPETGVRMVDDCYCVAMGSYYGSTMGTRYRVTFSTGTQINVILCDQKANIHTDKNNQYGKVYKDILEFYCEKSKIPSIIRTRGNYGNLEIFSGDIVRIEQYV